MLQLNPSAFYLQLTNGLLLTDSIGDKIGREPVAEDTDYRKWIQEWFVSDAEECLCSVNSVTHETVLQYVHFLMCT